MSVDVAVRLGLVGGQAATKGVEDFGNKGARSFREMKKEAASLPPHLVAVSRGVGALKDKVSDLSNSTGAIGNVASAFGGLGTAFAAGAAVVAVAATTLITGTKAALTFGDAIADAAANAGTSTDTLQEYRYAVSQTGGAAEDADTALKAFTVTLGAAQSGLSPKAMKAFTALGFTRDQLKSFDSFDDALRATIERIAAVSNAAEQAAIADKLGLTPMLPLIRQGVEALDGYRAAAHELGYVMDRDVVARLGDANDKFEASSQIINVQFKQAFVDLVPTLLGVMRTIGDLARETNNFFEGFKKVEERGLQALSDRRDAAYARMTRIQQGGMRDRVGELTRPLQVELARLTAEWDGLTREIDARRAKRTAEDQKRPVGGLQLELPSSSGGGAGGSGAAKARAELERARREAEKLELATRSAAGAALDYADATARAVAQARGDASTIDYLDRIKAYYDDINALVKAGVDLLEAKALVQERIVAEAKAEAHARSNPEGFVAAGPPKVEITPPSRLDYDFGWLKDGAGDAFHDGVLAAIEGGDFFEVFESRLRSAAASALADQLTRAVFGERGRGAGGGGWAGDLLGQVAGAVFGSIGQGATTPTLQQSWSNWSSPLSAPRATGGPVYRGDLRQIDEYGEERFARFSSDGFMTDAARTAREMTDLRLRGQSAYGGSGASPIAVNLNNRAATPLQATAVERDDGQGGRALDIDIVELVDRRVERGSRNLFEGRYDSAFSANYGVRRRLTGG